MNNEERHKAQSEAARKSWQDPEIRRKRLENRSKNKSWQASRSRVAKLAANVLHTKHRDVYLRGQEKHSVTARKLFQDSKFKAKHRKALRKAVVGNKERGEKISKTRKKLFKMGLLPKFWLKANVKVSKMEKLVRESMRRNGIACLMQFQVPKTGYTADIYIPSEKAIVEIDGHPSHWLDERIIKHGRKRDRVLKQLGYRVLHLKHKSLRKGVAFCLGKVKAFIAY